MHYQNKELEFYKRYYLACKEMERLDQIPFDDRMRDKEEQEYLSLRAEVLKIEKELKLL
jgi:hypothetical protein